MNSLLKIKFIVFRTVGNEVETPLCADIKVYNGDAQWYFKTDLIDISNRNSCCKISTEQNHESYFCWIFKNWYKDHGRGLQSTWIQCVRRSGEPPLLVSRMEQSVLGRGNSRWFPTDVQRGGCSDRCAMFFILGTTSRSFSRCQGMNFPFFSCE